MNFLLIILLIILVIIIAKLNLIEKCSAFVHNTLGGASDYSLPFTQVDMKSKDFTDVIANREIISKVHAFLQYSRPRVLKSFILQYASSVEVLNELYSDAAYDKLMLIHSAMAKDKEQKGDLETMNAELSAIEKLKNNQQKGLADLAKYRRNEGRVIQSLTVLSGDATSAWAVPGLHATAILVDYKNESIVYLDPHFHFTQPESYNSFLNVREKIIAVVPELRDFWYGNMYDVVGFSSACPIFQGSFKEAGLCPMWSIYLLLLFAINSGPKFTSIVKNHERNPRWTQSNLQQFIYHLYKRFKSEIDKIDLQNAKYDVIGEMSIDNVKGKYDCTSHGWLWSEKNKECYDTERNKAIAECEDHFYQGKCWKKEELYRYLQDKINLINSDVNMNANSKEGHIDAMKFSGIPVSIRERLQW
jgi:hypothetical protein